MLGEIAPNFKLEPYPKEPTIDDAIDRYKLALLNAIRRRCKEGEKAYICMKLTWLYRMKGSELENEKKFTTLTVQGFNVSYTKESEPNEIWRKHEAVFDKRALIAL